MTKQPKYVYKYIVQGNYGTGWDDLTAHDNRSDALAEVNLYDFNENAPHRFVRRRTLRAKEA